MWLGLMTSIKSSYNRAPLIGQDESRPVVKRQVRAKTPAQTNNAKLYGIKA